MSDPEQPAPVPSSLADPMNVDRQSIEGIFVEALGKASPTSGAHFSTLRAKAIPTDDSAWRHC